MEQEMPVLPFTKILVGDRTKLTIEQGMEQKVIVKTGRNLLPHVELTVAEDRLEIKNGNTCNWIRDYGDVEVHIISPNISEIRSSTGFHIKSEGLLSFQQLKLISEDTAGDYQNDGSFDLDLDVENLEIVANGSSAFTLRGKAVKANFGLYSGDCRIYSENLLVGDLQFFHRSTGPMVVNPQISLKGKIVSLGDVISRNRPPIVVVEELFRGKLMFE